MPRSTSAQLAFPEFSGITRQLVLWNLGAFFALAIVYVVSSQLWGWLVVHLSMNPVALLGGQVWRPVTYSFLHPLMNGAVIESLLEILSLWFLAGFLQAIHGSSWVGRLYAISVLGAAATEVLVYLISAMMGYALTGVLVGAAGGLIGLMSAIGLLHGEIEFQLFPLPIKVKAKYLAIIFILLAVAETFGSARMSAFSELGGALAALIFVRIPKRRGASFFLSERLYGLRNRYYRWKRRRTARKFEVYMRKQGRTVRFDGQGRQIDPDRTERDHDDKKRWN